MEALDQRIRPLYERGLGCRVIGETLGENPVTILKRVRILGIARTRSAAPRSPVFDDEVPFSGDPQVTELRKSAVGVAIRWFMDRGYMVSIPVDPTSYDLVTESDAGFQRVQVKTTNMKAKRTSAYMVQVSRTMYDGTARLNSSGKRTTVSYTKDEIDIFFIVTGNQDCYLVPLKVVGTRLSLTLDARFDRYKR
jgi:hypothetical protein